MSTEIKIPKVYRPLFELIEGHHPTVDVVIVTGGRYSGKSYTVLMGLAHAVAQFQHRLLQARYTMESAGQSIIPGFKSKLDLLGYSDYYQINKNTIESKFNHSRVFFKGLKTGSNTQDSALKSLEDVSIFCVEEASEIPTFEDFDKVHLSIRPLDVQGFSVLMMNPTHSSHWIYQKFFLDKEVKAGFNGIKNGVMYIHSAWTDLDESMITPMHLRRYKEAKAFYDSTTLEELEQTGNQKLIKKYVWYRDIVLGGWRDSIDNVIFEYWEEFDTWPTDEPIYHTLGLDFGFKDPNALVETKFYEDAIYVKEHLFKPDLKNSEIADAIKKIYSDNGNEIYCIADNARPEIIRDLNEMGCAVVACKKGAGSIKDGIAKINSTNLFVHKDSNDLQNELNNYHYVERINSKGERKIEPVDSFNHLIDALRYSLSLY